MSCLKRSTTIFKSRVFFKKERKMYIRGHVLVMEGSQVDILHTTAILQVIQNSLCLSVKQADSILKVLSALITLTLVLGY